MDPTTVIAILSFHLIASGCLLLLIRGRMPQDGGLGWFGVGSITYGLALVGRLKLGAHAVGLLSSAFDACMLLAMLLFQCGLQAFTGRNTLRIGWLAGALLGYLLVALPIAGAFGATGRHLLVNVVLGAQQLACAWLAVRAMRAAEPALHAPLATLGGLIGALGVWTLLRVVAVWAFGVETLFEGWPAQSFAAFCSFVGVLLTPLILWMVFVRLNARLAELATHDPLTGLLNRSGLDELLRRHFGVLPPLPIVVLQLDLDHFKRINDAHGHAAGDHALRAVAGALTGSVRAGDFVVRTGGEEFLVGCIAVLPNAGPLLAERLRAAVAGLRIDTGSQRLQCTISVGVSSVVRRQGGWEPALHQADEALYAAKQFGRDRVVVAADGPDDSDSPEVPATRATPSALAPLRDLAITS